MDALCTYLDGDSKDPLTQQYLAYNTLFLRFSWKFSLLYMATILTQKNFALNIRNKGCTFIMTSVLTLFRIAACFYYYKNMFPDLIEYFKLSWDWNGYHDIVKATEATKKED